MVVDSLRFVNESLPEWEVEVLAPDFGLSGGRSRWPSIGMARGSGFVLSIPSVAARAESRRKRLAEFDDLSRLVCRQFLWLRLDEELLLLLRLLLLRLLLEFVLLFRLLNVRLEQSLLVFLLPDVSEVKRDESVLVVLIADVVLLVCAMEVSPDIDIFETSILLIVVSLSSVVRSRRVTSPYEMQEMSLNLESLISPAPSLADSP